jgi:hypothetical protein
MMDSVESFLHPAVGRTPPPELGRRDHRWGGCGRDRAYRQRGRAALLGLAAKGYVHERLGKEGYDLDREVVRGRYITGTGRRQLSRTQGRIW